MSSLLPSPIASTVPATAAISPPLARSLPQRRYLLITSFQTRPWCVKEAAPPEILEVRTVVLDLWHDTTGDDYTYHSYVRPASGLPLSDLCSTTTGVEQSDVDGARPLAVVLAEHARFLDRFLTEGAVLVPTDDWVMMCVLPYALALAFACTAPAARPRCYERWVSIADCFRSQFEQRLPLPAMLRHVGLTPVQFIAPNDLPSYRRWLRWHARDSVIADVPTTSAGAATCCDVAELCLRLRSLDYDFDYAPMRTNGCGCHDDEDREEDSRLGEIVARAMGLCDSALRRPRAPLPLAHRPQCRPALGLVTLDSAPGSRLSHTPSAAD